MLEVTSKKLKAGSKKLYFQGQKPEAKSLSYITQLSKNVKYGSLMFWIRYQSMTWLKEYSS